MVPPLAPSCTDQVTAVDWEDRVPLTTAVKVAVAPVLERGDRGSDPDANASPSDVDRDGGRPASVCGAGGDDVERPLRRRGHVVARGVHCAPAALPDRPGDGLGPTAERLLPPGGEGKRLARLQGDRGGVNGQGRRVSHAAAAGREKKNRQESEKETDRFVRMGGDSRTQGQSDASQARREKLRARFFGCPAHPATSTRKRSSCRTCGGWSPREKTGRLDHGSEDPLVEIGLHRVQMASNEKLSCSHQRANQARELLTGKQ